MFYRLDLFSYIQYLLQVSTKLCYDYSGMLADTNPISFVVIYTVTIQDTRYIQDSVYNCGYVLAPCSKLALVDCTIGFNESAVHKSMFSSLEVM